MTPSTVIAQAPHRRGFGGWLARSAASLLDSARLVWWSAAEALSLAGLGAAGVFGLFGSGSTRSGYARLRHNVQRQARIASEQLGRRVPSQVPDEGLQRRRDLRWHLLHPLPGLVAGMLPFVVLGVGLYSLSLPLLLGWNWPHGSFSFFGMTWWWDPNAALLVVGIGLAATAAAPGVARATQEIHAHLVASRFSRSTHRTPLAALGHSARQARLGATEVTTLARFVPAATSAWFGRDEENAADASLESMHRNVLREADLAAGITGRSVVSPSPARAVGSGRARLDHQLSDPVRRRDLAWHLTTPLLSLGAFGVQAFLIVESVLILALPVLPWGWGFAPVDLLAVYASGFAYGGLYTVVASAAHLALAWPVAAMGSRLLASRAAHRLGAPPLTWGQLEDRVEELTATRRTALELQEAEIRRIERDLHDGAQARIVTMGMTLTQVSRLIDVDPDGARQLLALAKEDSSVALQDLRGLVRGIRPPVLADRGLTAAVRSLAASSPIEMRVTASLSDRLVAPLESALYFTVAELVANAVKHSAASEIVIDLEDEGDWAVARVTDNGIGGAVEGPFGGLAGIRARLAPFDGHLDVVSPVGGPTVVTARVPRPV